MPYKPQFWEAEPPYFSADCAPKLLGRLVKSYFDLGGSYTPLGCPTTKILQVAVKEKAKKEEQSETQGQQPTSGAADDESGQDQETPDDTLTEEFSITYEERSLKDVSGCLKATSSKNISALFTKMLEINNKKFLDKGLTYETAKIRLLRLENHEAIFNRLKLLEETKTWLEDNLTFLHPVFMVVGVILSTDAKIERNNGKEKEWSASTKIQPGRMVEIFGGPPTGNVADLELAKKNARTKKIMLKGKTEGETIMAVEFRIVSKSKAGLGKNVKLRGGPRFKRASQFSTGSEGIEQEDGSLIYLTEEGLENFLIDSDSDIE